MIVGGKETNDRAVICSDNTDNWVRQGGKESIGWLNCSPNCSRVIRGGRAAIDWLNLSPKYKIEILGGRLLRGALKSGKNIVLESTYIAYTYRIFCSFPLKKGIRRKE